MMKQDEFLWVEKYRPQTLEECILPSSLLDTFQQFVDAGEISNLLLCGTAGTGKTTVARALCNELGCDYIIINGSEESGIDVLRTKIKDFASTVSFEGKPKVVILDEADYLNPNSTQPALRAFIEEFSSNCRFIFTCNFRNRIIDPLHSRTTVVDFKLDKTNRQQMASRFMKRMARILDQQNVDTRGRWLVIDPVMLEILKDEDSRLLNADFGGSGLQNGLVLNNLHGFRVYVSNNLPSVGTGADTAGSANQNANYGVIVSGHDSAVASAEQINKVETYRDPDSFADIVRGMHLYGRKILRPEAICTAKYNVA